MRSFLLALIVLGSLPMIVVRPHLGVLVFSWLSYMNPHRFVWGFTAGLPWVLMVGGVTIVAWLASREPKRIPWNGATILLAAFALWISLTTLFAIYADEAYPLWDRAIKVLLFNGFVTLALMHTRERVHLLVWVIVVSIGFFGLKGGAWVLLTGGGNLVQGPPKSFFGSNNSLALALIMIVPLMRFLQLSTANRWIRWGLAGWMALSVVAIIGTHSRGAFVGLCVTGLIFLLKARKRLLIGTAFGLVVLGAITFMPEKWAERMETIRTYEQDQSALGRLKAWRYAIDLAAKRPLVGGGFGAFAGNLKLGSTTRWQNAHSVYFEVLGEHGYVGLILFLLLGVATLRAGTWIIRNARDRPELTWARDLASMLQVGLIGFAASGAFLNIAFFDLYYHFVVIMIITREIVKAELVKSESGSVTPESLPAGELTSLSYLQRSEPKPRMVPIGGVVDRQSNLRLRDQNRRG
jgi:probable O-glycosylation ligase (exosortase A-associated)